MISCIRPALARTIFLAHYFFMLTDEQTSPEQFAIYRRMTPERRLAQAEQLLDGARAENVVAPFAARGLAGGKSAARGRADFHQA
jgi:hypothetical protein